MVAAVIPACNEEENIQSVLDNLAHLLSLDLIIPVLNGCTDCTRDIVLAHPLAARTELIDDPLPLGIDVPRSRGALFALNMGADAVLFVDGDLQGNYALCLEQLICETLHHNCDLALTNCYPYIGFRSDTARSVLHYREKLNRKLGIFSTIGLATPSHGPHCVSRRLLSTVGTACLSTPPLMLAKAAQAHLTIRVAARLSANQWKSAERGNIHNQKIADTIIGDCIEAMQYLNHEPITREEKGVRYLGYRTPKQFI